MVSPLGSQGAMPMNSNTMAFASMILSHQSSRESSEMAEQTRHPLRLSPLGFATDMNLSASINNGHLVNTSINNIKRLEKLSKKSESDSIVKMLENESALGRNIPRLQQVSESACPSTRRMSAEGSSRLPQPKQTFASVRLKHNPEVDIKKAAASMLTNYGRGYQSPESISKVKGRQLADSELSENIRQIALGHKAIKKESSIFETFAPVNDKQARILRYQLLAKGEKPPNNDMNASNKNQLSNLNDGSYAKSRRTVPLSCNNK